VSGILRALASNLQKIASDLRLLSSGPAAGLGEIRLPARQAGSSIMPGKVNPVIPEAVTQAAIAVAGYDQMILQAAGLGSLELNPFLPLIAEALLSQLDLLTRACDLFARLCVDGIEADRRRCRLHVDTATAAATALVDVLGYDAAERLAAQAHAEGKPFRQVVLEQTSLTQADYDALVAPERVTRLGSEPLPRRT
ncbi:MAG: lyase family protein, partial [Thermoguttaceae bacterium]